MSELAANRCCPECGRPRRRCPGPVCYAVQCAAERAVAGDNAMFAVLRCYLFDGHDGPHNDCTEGVLWEAARLSGGGDLIRRAHETGEVRLISHWRPRGE